MTEIDFYVLASRRPAARLELVCRLAERACRRDQSVFVYAEDSHLLQNLDERLWSFRPSSFVPHRVLADNDMPGRHALEPVVLSSGEPSIDRRILINLASEVPAFFSRFTRTLEVIDEDDSVRDQGRARYRFYQHRGYPLRHHRVKDSIQV